jgi:hypothetical protein
MRVVISHGVAAKLATCRIGNTGRDRPRSGGRRAKNACIAACSSRTCSPRYGIARARDPAPAHPGRLLPRRGHRKMERPVASGDAGLHRTSQRQTTSRPPRPDLVATDRGSPRTGLRGSAAAIAGARRPPASAKWEGGLDSGSLLASLPLQRPGRDCHLRPHLGARFARMRCSVRRCMFSLRAVSDTLRSHSS